MTSETETQPQVRAWLTQVWAVGPKESTHVNALDEPLGISAKRLPKARQCLCLIATWQGMGAAMRFAWALPLTGLGPRGNVLAAGPDADCIRAPGTLGAVPAFDQRLVTLGEVDQSLRQPWLHASTAVKGKSTQQRGV